MKRIISLLLAVALIFTFASCGKKTDVSSDQSFVKPKNYSTVLLITINPQFRLYLDDQDNVLAVEPVNEDAKTVVKEGEFNGKLESVIEKIVTKTNDAGFVKENATLDLQIVETKKEQTKAESILNAVKDTADQAFKKIDITVEIKTSISENDTSSTETEPEHTHSFGNATCTSPKTCSCGATEGSALGHKFKNGKCTACGTADPNYTQFTSLSNKNGSWRAVYVYNDTYYSAGLKLSGQLSVGVTIGDPLSKMEQEVQDDIRNNKDQPGYKDSYIVYQGKEYWSARGGSSPLAPIAESGNTVTLVSSEDSNAQIVLTRTDENTLTVKSCSQTFKDMVGEIPVGTRFTFS